MSMDDRDLEKLFADIRSARHLLRWYDKWPEFVPNPERIIEAMNDMRLGYQLLDQIILGERERTARERTAPVEKTIPPGHPHHPLTRTPPPDGYPYQLPLPPKGGPELAQFVADQAADLRKRGDAAWNAGDKRLSSEIHSEAARLEEKARQLGYKKP